MNNLRTINFANDNIVNGLKSIAIIKFGEHKPINSKFNYAPTNNRLVNRALDFLRGMPAGEYRYVRCMRKINLANTTYSYIIGNISDEDFKQFLNQYHEEDKWFWCESPMFNTNYTKLLS